MTNRLTNFQNIKSTILIFVLAGFFTVSCENERNSDVKLSGHVIGYVRLFDSTRIILDDRSDVQVNFEGANPSVIAYTDEEGKYEINTLKTGTYNIIYSKEGYKSHKINGYQFTGGNVPTRAPGAYLFMPPNFSIDSVEADYNYFYNHLNISASIKGRLSSGSIYTRYYLSNKPGVSYEDYLETDVMYNANSDVLFVDHELDTSLFPLGSQVYIIMYPTTEPGNRYRDINTGKLIYTSINESNPSNVVEVDLPTEDEFE